MSNLQYKYRDLHLPAIAEDRGGSRQEFLGKRKNLAVRIIGATSTVIIFTARHNISAFIGRAVKPALSFVPLPCESSRALPYRPITSFTDRFIAFRGFSLAARSCGPVRFTVPMSAAESRFPLLPGPIIGRVSHLDPALKVHLTTLRSRPRSHEPRPISPTIRPRCDSCMRIANRVSDPTDKKHGVKSDCDSKEM